MFRMLTIVLGLSLTIAVSPALADKDFIKKDMRDKTTEFVIAVGQRLSHNNLTFVVHGGNKNLGMAAYRVAQRLDDEGIPIAFLLAPDRDNIDITMHVDFYTKGGTKYGCSAYDNHKSSIEKNEECLYEGAIKAYEFGFESAVTRTHLSTLSSN